VTIDETIDVAKPYGIPTVVLTMINFAVLLSVNLGVMNLLPLPALDGGRLLFMLIEVVRGKPVAPEKEGMVHFVGFVLLMILMVFVLYNDIAKIFA
jgi:regulator of sigma E protease